MISLERLDFSYGMSIVLTAYSAPTGDPLHKHNTCLKESGTIMIQGMVISFVFRKQ